MTTTGFAGREIEALEHQVEDLTRKLIDADAEADGAKLRAVQYSEQVWTVAVDRDNWRSLAEQLTEDLARAHAERDELVAEVGKWHAMAVERGDRIDRQVEQLLGLTGLASRLEAELLAR